MSEVKRYDCTSGGSQFCYGCYTMTEEAYGDYVRFEDYETLRAELAGKEKALAAAKTVIEAKDKAYALIDQRFAAMAAKAATTDSERECNERLTAEIDALTAELAEARRQLKEADSQKCIASIVPDGTTHIRKIGRRSFAGGEYALYFECFKNDGAQWLYYHTDNDNEYPCWCNLLDGRYRNPDEVISSLVSIIVPVPQPAVPEALIKEAATYLDHFGRADLASELRAILATKEGKKDGL